MSRRYELTDQQWNRIEALRPGRPGNPGGQGQDNRRFVNAVIWVARSERTVAQTCQHDSACRIRSFSGSIAGPSPGFGNKCSENCRIPIWPR